MAVNLLLKRSGTASKRPDAANMALGEIDLNYDATTGGIYYKDSNGAVVKVGPCQVSATAPNASPAGSSGNSAGEFWYDTANSALKVWDGTSWVAATGTSAFLPLAGGTMTGDITFNGSQTFPVAGIQNATTTQKGVVQIGTNLSVSSGTVSVATAAKGSRGVVSVGTNINVVSGEISVASASTSTPGIVQLVNTTTSVSTTTALTAAMGRSLQQQIDALNVSNNLTLAGTIDGSTGNMLTVTSEGTADGFVVGQPMPSPSTTVAENFVIVTVAGTMTPPGGSAQAVNNGDWWLASSSTWNYIASGYVAPSATTTTAGLVTLATDTEVQDGTNTTDAVVPSSLQSKISDSTSTTSSTTIASSTAVKSAYDAASSAQSTADAAIPKSTLSATGSLIYASGASTPANLSIGTAGQVLTVSAGGLPEWAAAGGGSSLTGITSSVTTALGLNALTSLTDPSVLNTAIGFNAGTAITDGDRNTLVGYSAGQSLTGEYSNTYVGYQSGINSTAGGNVSIGTTSGPIGAASSCVFVGVDAGSLTSGSFNVGVGVSAVGKATGSFNTGLGHTAGQSITSGASNTLVGRGAGSAITTGSNNTIIGRYSGTTTLQNNFVVSCDTDIKIQINENDALSIGSLGAFGNFGDVLTSSSSTGAPTWQAPVWYPLNSVTTTSTTPTAIAFLPLTTYRGATLNISASNATGGSYHCDSWMVIHDGTTASVQLAAPGAHIGPSPYNVTATISGGNVNINVVSASTNSTKYSAAIQLFAI